MIWHKRTDYPAALADWLLETGSLTARLNALCGAPIRVVRQREGIGRICEHEQAAYGPLAAKGWVREVILHHPRTDDPLLWARTYIPDFNPGNPWYELAKIGEKPLGEVLFTLQGITRSPLQTGKIFAAEKVGDPPLWHGRWGRHSRFERNEAPLILTEVFLFEPDA
ncbi:chorismate lyase [Sulfurivirga caldicuralii]|uniref:Probable chorismate pyruvate-lyase n=1 Tax=Sulfurivirga caldicuralii TaxID=364032 RepID=A0A1N6H7K9_9GAMM|nr:chorismate lyase [Sulfurivirga caldicuralii]SIO15746.1 chorismate lyase [Sulfurivirga caldicuralii]